MNFFGSDDNDEDNSRSAPIMTPYMNINPHFLDTADEYILPEDAGPIRSRAQMMFSTIGTATVLGAGIGGSESLRYSGLQWIKVCDILTKIFSVFPSFIKVSLFLGKVTTYAIHECCFKKRRQSSPEIWICCFFILYVFNNMREIEGSGR